MIDVITTDDCLIIDNQKGWVEIGKKIVKKEKFH